MVILANTRGVCGASYDPDVWESGSSSSPEVESDSSAGMLVWWLVPNDTPQDAQSMIVFHAGARLGGNRA
eukprot:5436667-Lingulodinium_polyedra.AAC.1